MDFKKIIESFNYDIDKEVDIFNQGIFELSKKEKIAFKETLKFIKAGNINSYKDEYLRNFYYLQLLLELVNRFKKEMNISDESIKYLNVAIEDIKLAFRFQMLGYYNTSGIHLRGFFEKIIHFIVIHYIETGRIDKSFKKKFLKDKINECLKKGDFSFKNKDNEGKDIYNKYYFPTDQVLKLYSHYSFDYVHDGAPTSDIKFDKLEFKKIDLLFKLTHTFVGRFIKVTIGQSIEKYWDRKINKQIEDYPCYWNYLQSYFGENKIFSDQYSYVYNIIHDDKDNKEFAFNILKLNKNNLFSKEYLDRINNHDRLWKKAKGDRKKYWELYEKDLNKKSL